MFKRKAVNVAALVALGAVLPGVAVAQETLQRVEVTGSRIKTINTDTASPVISLGTEAIKVEGQRDVEGLMNNLPQVFADQGAQVSNGSSGTATVNLRNLGANRTMVLINGRRMPAGSPKNLAADLNQIPVSLVKRVDLLTGGASAVYGSDAIAGVVNFVMNDKFQGVEFEVNHQFFNHQQHNAVGDIVRARGFPVPGDKSADGKATDFSLTMGSNFADGKGNATLFIGHKKQHALLQSERDFTACALNAGAAFTCGGSGTSYPGQFTDFENFALTVADANGGVRDYVGATDAYNFGPLNYFRRPSDRYTAAAYAHYDISDAARVYAEFNFHDDHTVAQIAPSGLFFYDTSLMGGIRSENPLLSPAWRTALGITAPGSVSNIFIGRRNVEGGGRADDLRHTSYRAVGGVKGDITSNWNYDVSVQAGKVVYQETYKNDFSNTRIGRALDVVTNPANGQPVCRSVLDGTDPNCVPYNIWSLNKVTPEALAYLQTPGFQKGSTQQNVATASISGDLTDYGVKTPWAKSGLGIVFGLERRTEKMELSTDQAFTTGDLAGQGGPTIGVGGQYSVNDVFGELRMPLIEKAPMAEMLSVNLTYRGSDYSTNKKTDTYGLGLEWMPVKEAKLRASYQQASRAANIIELFSAQAIGLYDNDEDPCAGATPTATAAECARTGVTAAQYGRIADSPAGQYNAIFGGNANLKPETANSLTVGVVLQPIKDLTASIDYFDIKVKDLIATVGAPVALQQCLTTGNPVFCNLIHRDRVGTLWATPDAYIVSTNTNIGSLKTAGVDAVIDYTLRMGAMGKLNFNAIGTYLKKYVVEDVPGLATYDCAGLYGATCGTPMPTWRHKLRATWETPWDVSLAATWRHISSVDLDTSSGQSRLSGAVPAVMKTLGQRDYLDIAASYKISKNLMVRGSINNVLDRDPPLRSNGSGLINGNTYPVVYDAEGRRISLNVTATF